jgi:hypothetical protein
MSNNILYKCNQNESNKLYVVKENNSFILFIFSIIQNNKMSSITVYLDGKYKRHSDGIIKQIDYISFDNIINFVKNNNHIKTDSIKESSDEINYVIHMPKNKLVINENMLNNLDDCTKHIIQILSNYITKFTPNNEYLF